MIRAIPFQNIIIILLRLIPTEVVYDQSYPIPESDLPFASETAGMIIF